MSPSYSNSKQLSQILRHCRFFICAAVHWPEILPRTRLQWLHVLVPEPEILWVVSSYQGCFVSLNPHSISLAVTPISSPYILVLARTFGLTRKALGDHWIVGDS